MAIVFSLLTIYFCYEAYKKNAVSKKIFTIISIIEGTIAVSAAVFEIM